MNRLILISPGLGALNQILPDSYGKRIVIIFGCHICCPWRMGCVSFLMAQVAFSGCDRKIKTLASKRSELLIS
jgi:hypothetical protein